MMDPTATSVDSDDVNNAAPAAAAATTNPTNNAPQAAVPVAAAARGLSPSYYMSRAATTAASAVGNVVNLFTGGNASIPAAANANTSNDTPQTANTTAARAAADASFNAAEMGATTLFPTSNAVHGGGGGPGGEATGGESIGSRGGGAYLMAMPTLPPMEGMEAAATLQSNASTSEVAAAATQARPTSSSDIWICECGNEVSTKKKRCGKCCKWRDGKRPNMNKPRKKKSKTTEVGNVANGNAANAAGVSPTTNQLPAAMVDITPEGGVESTGEG